MILNAPLHLITFCLDIQTACEKHFTPLLQLHQNTINPVPSWCITFLCCAWVPHNWAPELLSCGPVRIKLPDLLVYAEWGSEFFHPIYLLPFFNQITPLDNIEHNEPLPVTHLEPPKGTLPVTFQGIKVHNTIKVQSPVKSNLSLNPISQRGLCIQGWPITTNQCLYFYNW